jgi:pilus assembly protein CpaF
MARFLEEAVKSKLNIIISGGTGTGKTSILNMLSSFIGENERIITIEDAAELNLKQKHVISLETRNVNYEGTGEVTIRDLVRNSLRMRPDRIIVGEVRGNEAFDMLQAMNTGHTGSLTTLHANSASDALNRLESMILMTGIDMPLKAIREYIKSAIDLVVHVDRMPDGMRKIISISEVIDIKNGQIELNEIFKFTKKGITKDNEVDGEFSGINELPKIINKMNKENIEDIFK